MEKRVYRIIYPCLAAYLLLLSSCGSNRRLARTEPAAHKDSGRELKQKYAGILQVPVSDITNQSLYEFIDSWYGVPYKFAGRTKAGVDCSDFVSLLYEKAYGVNISGTSADLFDKCKAVKETELKEGDLVFFRINSRHISHVGVYLQNNKFVHASVHAGVVISSLNEPYYKKYFYKAGKLR
ncbi:MAG: glycoside hydrolase [Bacteroidia bacterium]|jgi:lipoprotein Spr|nr:glycoside hydrolase [Bacteroidia bacterium]